MALHSHRVAKNSIFLTGALVGQKLLAFVYFTIISRFLAVPEIGKYVFALSFTTIFSVFIDFGFSNVLVREAARERARAKELLSSILTSKIIFSAAAVLAVVFFVNVLGYEEETKLLVYLASLVMVLDSFHLTFYAVLRGFQRLEYEALGMILGQIFIITFGAFSLIAGAPNYFLIIALIVGSSLNVCISLMTLLFKAQIIPTLSFNKKLIYQILRTALPFGLAAIFTRIYSYIDTILLSLIKGDAAVGWYSVPYKITFAFTFIPQALMAAVYPALSYYYTIRKELMAQIFEKAFFLFFFIGLPISFGIWSLAEPIIITLYGEAYRASIPALKLLIFSLIFGFLYFPLGALLNAADKQSQNTKILGATMVANIILNLLLIPKYSFLGAGIAALSCNVLLFALGFTATLKIARYDFKIIGVKSFKSLFAAGLMAFGVRSGLNYLPLIVLVPAGAFIYAVFMFASRAVTFDELRIFKNVFARKTKIIESGL